MNTQTYIAYFPDGVNFTLYQCSACGCLVGSITVHDLWHDSLDQKQRQAEELAYQAGMDRGALQQLTTHVEEFLGPLDRSSRQYVPPR